jgi:aspartate racemase
MMKTIGLLGGMSWESSIEYYRIINEVMRAKLGGLHSAKSVMVSVDFALIEELQNRNKWDDASEILIASARQVEAAGADFLIIATNTMHKLYERIQDALEIPILHIADATAVKIQEINLEKVGLLGTIYTMEQEFYKGRLIQKYGLQVLVPEKTERKLVNRIIFDELVLGDVKPESKVVYKKIAENLIELGAEGIILGCTEIPLLINANDISVPTFDTTFIHAEMAVEIALDERAL